MEYKKLYELLKDFGGYRPNSSSLIPVLNKEEHFLKTKNEWMEIFSITEKVFDSLLYLKIFKEVEFGIKVIYEGGTYFTIWGISDLAPCGEIAESIEKMLREKYKNKINV